jgi:eukaryotic-like serine/threonine-protein kinase
MGEVFLAKQSLPMGFERPIVVKRILPHLSDDEKFVELFLREAHTASRFQHENIVPIYQVGMEQSRYYIAMEYVQGKDLRAFLLRAAEGGIRLPPELGAHIIACVCRGLGYVHRKSGPDGIPLRLVHRDVSPQNILLSYEGDIRLTDFGISKATGVRGGTRPGTLKGKIPYLSPEQARGDLLDHRSDIFSTGVVLCELLTGGPLFTGESDFAILEGIRGFSIKGSLESRLGQLPPLLAKVVARSLQAEAEDRYPDIRQMHEDLDTFLGEQGFRNGSSTLALWMNRLFAEEMAREGEELSRTRTVVLPARAQPRLGEEQEDSGETDGGQAADAPVDRRILKHRLVIMLLALLILFEAFLFVWRDYQWRQRHRAAQFAAPAKRPAAGWVP